MATVYRTNPGAGDVISTTNIGGAEVQNIKLVDASAANIGVNGNPLYVIPAAGSSVAITSGSPLEVVNPAGGRLNVELTDSGDAELGVTANPVIVSHPAGSSINVSDSPLTGLTPYLSASEEGNANNVATGAATLYKLTCTLGKTVTAARWLFIFDDSAVPVSGRTNLKYPPLLIPEGGMIEVEFFKDPQSCSTGISFGISDDSASYNQAGVANFRALYI